jgi:hypothetical protein
MNNRSRKPVRNSALSGLSGVLPARPVNLVSPNSGVRSSLLRCAGALLTLAAALPFLSTPAKASLQQWANTTAGSNSALHRQTTEPGKYLQFAGHTDIPHHDSNPHGDQTDPWGTHVDTDSHADGAHIDYNQDDNGES